MLPTSLILEHPLRSVRVPNPKATNPPRRNRWPACFGEAVSTPALVASGTASVSFGGLVLPRAEHSRLEVLRARWLCSEAKPKASPPVWAWPPRPHSLVPPTKPVPLIRGVPEQYALSLLGLAATRTKAVLDRQPPQARPRKPAKPCAARTKVGTTLGLSEKAMRKSIAFVRS